MSQLCLCARMCTRVQVPTEPRRRHLVPSAGATCCGCWESSSVSPQGQCMLLSRIIFLPILFFYKEPHYTAQAVLRLVANLPGGTPPHTTPTQRSSLHVWRLFASLAFGRMLTLPSTPQPKDAGSPAGTSET